MLKSGRSHRCLFNSPEGSVRPEADSRRMFARNASQRCSERSSEFRPERHRNQSQLLNISMHMTSVARDAIVRSVFHCVHRLR